MGLVDRLQLGEARARPTWWSSIAAICAAAPAGETAAECGPSGRAEANVRLMQESIRMCRDFASQMKINVWFRQGGYLFLARIPRDNQRPRSRGSVKLQTECGLGDANALAERSAATSFPQLDTEGVVVSASYNPDDGVVFPLAVRVGLRASRDQARASRSATFADVVGIQDGPARASTAWWSATSVSAARAKRPPSRPTWSSTRAGAWSPGDRQDARGGAPQHAASSRDLLDRAAQAVAQAAGRRPHRWPLFQPIHARRDRRRGRPRAGAGRR